MDVLKANISSHDVWFYENGNLAAGQEAHVCANQIVHFGNNCKDSIEYSCEHVVKIRKDDNSVGDELTLLPKEQKC